MYKYVLLLTFKFAPYLVLKRNKFGSTLGTKHLLSHENGFFLLTFTNYV